jgi:hypothetical protein
LNYTHIHTQNKTRFRPKHFGFCLAFTKHGVVKAQKVSQSAWIPGERRRGDEVRIRCSLSDPKKLRFIKE